MNGQETRGGAEATRDAGFWRTFIAEHQEIVLSCWEDRVRALEPARDLDGPALLNHVPALLAHIVNLTDELRTGIPAPRSVTEEHAIERVDQEFGLATLVDEIGILRSCIMVIVERSRRSVPLAEIRILHEAIDRAVASTIDRYARARERTLRTFERIANAALDSRSLDDLARRFLAILVQTSEAIDSATILVREDDYLRVRATVGLEGGVAEQVRVPIDDSFSGFVATSRQPLELRDASHDPRVKRAALVESGVRALYGIPLIEGGEVIAVAHMGSLTVDEFSSHDRRLFRDVAGRATAAISQHLLREAAERTAAELREREDEFRTLADNIPHFAWMANEHGELYWYNQRFCDYTGASVEELRRTGPTRYQHPDHTERVMSSFREAVALGEPWEETFPMLDRAGRYRWFLTRAIPIRDHRGKIVRWFGTNTDITEQRFLDEATKVLGSSLDDRAILQELARLAVPDLADWCVVDLVGEEGIQRVAIAHSDPIAVESAREWHRRYPPVWDAPIGVPSVIRSAEPLFVPEISEQALQEAARDEAHHEALRALGLVSCIIVPLLARDRTLGAITLLTAESRRIYDSSDLEVACELGRRAGMAVDNARLYRESQQALTERERAVQSRDEVLAIVSHDLRGPLNNIGLGASMLYETSDIPATKKQLELIQRSALRMEHMIDELLDMATIQARGLTLQRTREDIDGLVTAVVEAHVPRAAANEIRIVRECEAAGVTISCDRDRVERVFGNLIGNAIKFCRAGDMIFLRCHLSERDVVFSVGDTGPGIPPEQVPHLFEPYWTAGRQAIKKGTGLGLYICRGIVEAHGGKLWVKSTVSEGTEFFFTLPRDGA